MLGMLKATPNMQNQVFTCSNFDSFRCMIVSGVNRRAKTRNHLSLLTFVSLISDDYYFVFSFSFFVVRRGYGERIYDMRFGLSEK